ncbi:MAG: hypothetical protein IMW89_14745, partial [Ktedonobacteraceae bacterium]|nr:hypothetical protein [Ktedonobacteraceae bacterium]
MVSLSRAIFGAMVGMGILIIFFVLFHLGGSLWQFSPLISAIVSGVLVLYSALTVPAENENVESWLGRERLGWILIGCGLLAWGCGESIWRYYTSINLSPFPSLADIGYASLPPLVFTGLLILPSSGNGLRRVLMLLDSLIVMGSMLSIGWYLLLGDLAFSSSQDMLAKFLGIYYPTFDIALLSCVVLLLFRSQGSLYQALARRVALIMVGAGLCLFAGSDFLFNLQQSAGVYADGTWIDLGWPLGMLVIGLAAHCRRYLPSTPQDMIEHRLRHKEVPLTFGIAQMATYTMLAILLMVMAVNVFSSDATQVAIRPLLVVATVCVVGLVVVRHLITVHDNENLTRRQKHALERLESANMRIEEQARMISERNAELEQGILHLKDVQAQLANGNLRARARLTAGELLPLAVSLNLMAERLMHFEQAHSHAQRLNAALREVTTSIELYRKGETFRYPASCKAYPELNRLLRVLGFKEKNGASGA